MTPRPISYMLLICLCLIFACGDDGDLATDSRFQPAEVDTTHHTSLDPESGLVAEGEYLIVRGTCTACHSANLILQNRMTRDDWLKSIRWMQKTQGLWELPADLEGKILDYLGKHYAPDQPKSIRRQPLQAVQWHRSK